MVQLSTVSAWEVINRFSIVCHSGVAIQHSVWYSEWVEVCQHRQHGRPPQEVQVQHDHSSGRGDPSAVHVFHQRAHERGKVFTLSSQTSSISDFERWNPLLDCSETTKTQIHVYFPSVFTDSSLFQPQKDKNSRLSFINCWLLVASLWK